MADLRQAAQQALEALLAVKNHGWDEDTHAGRALIAALRAALAEPDIDPVDEYRKGFIAGQIDMRDRPEEQPELVLVESALQAVAEKIGDQCAVWYGIGARDVEAVLIEAARHGLVHGALAEPVQEPVAWRVRRNDGQYELYFVKASAERAAECYIKRPQVEPLYAAPPQRKPLSGIQVERLLEQVIGSLPVARNLIRAVERAHKIGGEG